MCYCPTPTLHLNLALTGDGAFLFSLKKTHSVWFISVLNYGDTENVLINHLLLVIPMSYPCHYTNLCPHKSHKHAHTHTHTHTHTLTCMYIIYNNCCFLWFTGTLHRRNGFYTVQTVFSIDSTTTIHLILPLRENFVHFYFLKKTTFIWFINLFNYGDTKNVLINHLLLVTPMSYLCHFTNLCPHKPHKHAPPPHIHVHIYIYIYIYI